MATSLCVQAATLNAPVAPVRVVTEQFHGTAVLDPYRYMENLKDPKVRSWLMAQGDLARTTLDKIAIRDTILNRIEALDAQRGDVVRDVVHSGSDAIFYLKRLQGERLGDAPSRRCKRSMRPRPLVSPSRVQLAAR